jgi:flagellar hook-associated protein 1
MSLNNILNIGTSGLMASQNQLSVISDNITNINTPGYVRKTLAQQSRTTQGVGAGVTTGQVQLATDKYLQQTSLNASSSAAQYAAFSELVDNIQSQFGNLTDSGSLFNLASSSMASLATLAESPNSSTQKQIALSNMQSFFSEAQRLSGQIQSVRAQADAKIVNDVNEINDLVKNIADLNTVISSAHVSGADATGAQATQSQYIDRLSQLIDVKVTTDNNGATSVRTNTGMVLAGDSYATLKYQPSGNTSATTAYNPIYVVGANGTTRDLADQITSGELKGLMDVRDNEAPALSAQLSQYVASFADAANYAHNNATSVPAPNSLTGKKTSQTLTENLTGMTGQVTLTALNSAGTIMSKVAINFDASPPTYNLNDSASPIPLNMATLDSDITALTGGDIHLSFDTTTNALTMSSDNSAYGVAATNVSGAPSNKNGQSFSQVFGLNDLVTSTTPINYQTGLTLSSNHGFTGGDIVNFSLNDTKGVHVKDIAFAIPSAPANDMQSLKDALNDPTTGLGKYLTFDLSLTGELTYTTNGTTPVQLTVASDDTQRLGTGTSFSQFFGIGGAANARASNINVSSRILNNSNLLGTATVDTSALVNTQGATIGDGSGATALAKIGSNATTFPSAGHHPGGMSSLDSYASDLAGQIGVTASTAQARSDAAEAIYTEATARRQSVEGVNLDEELVKMTTFQQAYSASSRIIQAAKDMYDVLLNMVN